MIANFHRRDSLTNRLNDTSGLVTKNARELSLRVLTGECVQIRVAESVGDNFQAHFARFRRSNDNFFNSKRLVGSVSLPTIHKMLLVSLKSLIPVIPK